MSLRHLPGGAGAGLRFVRQGEREARVAMAMAAAGRAAQQRCSPSARAPARNQGVHSALQRHVRFLVCLVLVAAPSTFGTPEAKAQAQKGSESGEYSTKKVMRDWWCSRNVDSPLCASKGTASGAQGPRPTSLEGQASEITRMVILFCQEPAHVDEAECTRLAGPQRQKQKATAPERPRPPKTGTSTSNSWSNQQSTRLERIIAMKSIKEHWCKKKPDASVCVLGDEQTASADFPAVLMKDREQFRSMVDSWCAEPGNKDRAPCSKRAGSRQSPARDPQKPRGVARPEVKAMHAFYCAKKPKSNICVAFESLSRGERPVVRPAFDEIQQMRSEWCATEEGMRSDPCNRPQVQRRRPLRHEAQGHSKPQWPTSGGTQR